MKVDSSRVLIIQSKLGYGSIGDRPIHPNSTLVYIVDLINVK